MNNTYILLLLLGSYYGFLATLPLGPSKLLCVRNFLITTKGSERFNLRSESAHSILIAGISGLIIAQIIILLSIYSPSLYALWLKPHVLNLLFIPVLFFHWHKLRLLETDTYNDPVLGNSNVYKIRLQTAFFETLFIQLLNPIVLPDGVFSRLMGVFLFRYSNIITFIGGIFLGILGGYTLFFVSTCYLLQRLEQDTPTIYRLVKRVIHQFFFPLFFIIGLIVLGRAPIPSIKNFSFTKEPWQEKSWPDILYNYDTWKRPLRFLKNNQTSYTEENIRAFNKLYFSQDFFEIYKKDGQQKLYHNTPEHLSLVSRDFNKLLDIPQISEQSPKEIFDEWAKEKENRKKQIYNSIANRLLSFEKGLLLEDIVEKKLASTIYNGNLLSKDNDPRLGMDHREEQDHLYSKSPLFLTKANLMERNSFLSGEKSNLLEIYTTNRIKLFLEKNVDEVKDIPTIGWIEEKLLTDKNNGKVHFPSKENLHTSLWSIDQIELLKNNNVQSWHNVLSKIQKTITGKNLSKIQNEVENPNNLIDNQNIGKFANMYKEMPLWNSKISRADLQTPEPNEFRSILANFVRHLLPGSIRARRRKALAWNAYQNRPHAPIFLHAIESLNLENSLNSNDNQDFVLIQNDKLDNKQNVHILKTRWNFPIAHFVRGIALCSQAYIRRYIKLPIYIIVKNISRQILFQPTEWQKDWTDLAQEVYIDCDYDGNDLYVGVKLPNILELTGKQVKIIRPFRLRYSPTSTYKDNNVKVLHSNEKNRLNYELDDYSYLTIWGDETYEPFGKIKNQPPFWQPILQRINLILRYKIYKKYVNFIEKFSWLTKYSQELVGKMSIINKNISKLIQGNVHEEKTQNSIGNQGISTDVVGNNIKNKNTKSSKYLNNNKKKKDSKNTGTKDALIVSSKETILINPHQLHTDKTEINPVSENYTKNLLLKETTNVEDKKDILIEKSKSLSVQQKKNRKYNIKNSLIYFQRNLFTLKRSLIQLQKNISYNLSKTKVGIYRILITNVDKLIRLTQEMLLAIRKSVFYLNAWIGDSLSQYILIIQTFRKKSSAQSIDSLSPKIANKYDNFSNTKLSQAHVLHKIWEENELSNPNITTLSKVWNDKELLNKNVSDLLSNKGILGNDIPENIQYQDWQEWIKNIPGYQPYLKIWSHIMPSNWSNSVTQYWKEISGSNNNLTKDHSDHRIGNLNYLVYHTPLFEKAQKFHKIAKLSNLIQSYTHIGSLNGLSNRQNSYMEELTQTPEKGINIDFIQNNLLKELPIIQKEMDGLNSNLQLTTLKERISFPASYENKWKSKELKNRFRNLMKAAKQRNVLKESIGEKKHKIALPDQMRKDLSIFYQNYQPEDLLFVSVLENWRYKVLDDELLMFNIISAFLKFSQKEQNVSTLSNELSISRSVPFDVLPEELLLPQHIRELRILDNIDFEFSHNHNSLITKSSSQSVNKQLVVKKKSQLINKTTQDISAKDTITRFLWPKHRLEDLLYINRFLLGTSNQSRFSVLRLHSIV